MTEKNLWYCDYLKNNTTIYKIDLQGKLLYVIQVSVGWIRGLTFDGVNLWCLSVNRDKKYNEADRNVIYQIDTEGNILKSFDLWFDDQLDLPLTVKRCGAVMNLTKQST